MSIGKLEDLKLGDLQQLYETDDYQWLLTNIKLLKNRQFDQLDLENLIEELTDLGNEKKNAVRSLLEQIIRHLLLIQYWQEEHEINSHHWQSELLGFRYQMQDRLTTNLQLFLAQEMENTYQRALKFVQIKTKFKLHFPPECPYTLEQLLNIDYPS
ncbi:DUF29 domain-containing protein [Cylindrospermopsis raciborskii]|uniref:DUF29 domain-containing protein n=1 Tax=Cylindrospermopsis raciborskii CENA302 TaxID=1170768 RepID=A0A9Q5QWM9_9CYAN|nr:DUF29 domain-containing protein [Cylindrospermopsis raciborskii]OHY36422.1 hypothetical protein BCV64_01235 [Cylindrospermopsis raciborskii MVCC14]OPH09725.1 hypothetical protein CENA302_07985 [Cylindrospermopsis raciborskii CENA302]